ncbi:helicase-related protein [Malaciobacter marinus]|uniref:helicase-related protein n=1 Tax=Malaciobacter marinus TaxID=505249 RepID=UPI003B008A96
MLIDNENQNKKVYEWINDYTEDGTLDIVTGYFTVGALGYLSKATNNKINKYRFILGDIVSTEQPKNYTINLLNENIGIEASLQLSSIAKEAVEFLKQSKVETKTLEPNFCHAKAYIYNDKKDERLNYFISGSSNLTEAGIGLKHNNNVELNIAETGDNNQFKKLLEWFDELWDKPQAHYQKTIVDENGNKSKQNFKEYLIKQIEQIFIKYTPKELYYKVLFELFGEELLKEQEDPNFNREVGKLENTNIYNSLYDFQQKGVFSLIKMLEHYNGAILADAVGLGKTWSALAVIKYYQLQGRETILLCPKKLENNWNQYQKTRNSQFKDDKFEYIVRYHTDLFENRLEKDNVDLDHLQNDTPKLLVIDESHNLRNAKSNRYKFLVETILKKNQNIKVLLLSATPINNTLNDIKNQFSLMVKDEDHGFYETLGIRSLEGTFRKSQTVFNTWAESKNNHISELIKELPNEFSKFTDSLTVARTRNMIKKYTNSLDFPYKKAPQNIYESPKYIGEYKTFTELFDNLPDKLTAYKPAYYIKDDEKEVTKNEKLRDKALIKMMYMLLAKRFESSWKSFYDTVVKIHEYHQNILSKVIRYEETKQDQNINQTIQVNDSHDIDEEYSIGKREIKLSQIKFDGYLEIFKIDLIDDIKKLEILINNLTIFKQEIELENTFTSKDSKFQKLIEIINNKQQSKNKKIIIFTAYTDTASYIYEELEKRGLQKMALVHGNTKDYETTLEKFAPYTKLYKSKLYKDCDAKDFKSWKQWIKQNDPYTQSLLDDSIDILIATDVLSEGQNLQDADMVVNYDIHWNPVRVIQRLGRIDRIGSPNDTIEAINFWPSSDINDYLNLQTRIEQKMATMKVVGSEIDTNFTNELKKIADDENLENSQIAKMLRQMETTLDDIETNDTSLGFNNLSLEEFRQDLFEELKSKKEYYQNMPKGVFTGFIKFIENIKEKELIALLQNRVNKEYELIYIDKDGNKILQNIKDILEVLGNYKNKPRDDDGLVLLDKGNQEAINELTTMIKNWAKPMRKSKGSKLLNGIMIGGKKAMDKLNSNTSIEKEFDINNYDLIVWFVVR